MMIKKWIVAPFLSFACIASLRGMEITYLSNTNKTDLPYITRDIYNNRSFNTYASAQFVSNQKAIIEAQKNATRRGATIDLALGKHPQNILKERNVTTLTCADNIHAKITTALDCSPSKGIPTKSVLKIGSDNDANAGWSHDLNKPHVNRSFESAIYIENNIPLTIEAHNTIKSNSPMKPQHEKEIIFTTPEKSAFYSSKKTNLTASWAQRLYSLARDTSDNRSALIETMNVNDENIIDASIAAKKSGAHVEWHVNHTALTKNGLPLLQKLYAAEIPTHVFEPAKGYHAIQHKKNVTITKGKKSTIIVSNGNFTHEGDNEFNCAIEIPNNPAITRASVEDFKRNITRSQSFKEAEKRKLEKIETDSIFTKKQKK